MRWLSQNIVKLETLVQTDSKIWDLKEWETFERWSYCICDRLEVAKAQLKKLEDEHADQMWRAQDYITKLQGEHAEMQQQIDLMNRNVSTFPTEYRDAWGAIEELVCNHTGRVLGPPKLHDPILGRVDALVTLITH